MSKKYDKRRQIRLTPENEKWIAQYQKTLAFPASFDAVANRMMEKGKTFMPNSNG
jgi:hypothetical protein